VWATYPVTRTALPFGALPADDGPFAAGSRG
jgi:hypothetical protein